MFIGMLINCSTGVTDDRSWTLTDANGTSHNFPESGKNKTTILLFWATWCPYCKRLMPHLQSVLYEYGDKLDLQIYALNVNEDDDPVAYIDENGYDFLLFKEAEQVAKIYGVKGTPGVLVFDRNGQQVFDLSQIQSEHLIKGKKPHWQRAIKKAPFWAAELRKKLAQLK